MLPAITSQKNKKSSIGKNLFFSSILSFFFFSLIEVILHLAPISDSVQNDSDALPLWVITNLQETNFIRDRLLFWKVAYPSHRLKTNTYGLRGREFSIKKELDVFRIITLGDSCTWGFGVQPGEEYPHLLEIELNRSSIRRIFEVQNAGVPGYSSLQALRYFESKLLSFDPDLITVYCGRNDRRLLTEEGGYSPDHEVPVPSQFNYIASEYLNKARTYRLLRNIVFKLKQKTFHPRNPSRGISVRKNRQHRVEPDEFEQNIREILQLSARSGIEVIGITSPVSSPSVGNYNALARSIYENAQTIFLDAEAEFEKHSDEGWLVDDCHPSQTGHQWIADNLAKLIRLRFNPQ